VVFFEVPDDGLDRRAPAHFAFDLIGHAALLAGGIDLESVGRRGIVAGVGDDAGECCADPGLDRRDDAGQRVAVIGLAGQRLDVGDELTAPGASDFSGLCNNKDIPAFLRA